MTDITARPDLGEPTAEPCARCIVLEDLLETATSERDKARYESAKADDETLALKVRDISRLASDMTGSYSAIKAFERRAKAAEARVTELEATRPDALAGKLADALTPSGDTKAAYMGEFEFTHSYCDEDGYDHTDVVTVPWTTIKEIMAAIRKRAALAEWEAGRGE